MDFREYSLNRRSSTQIVSVWRRHIGHIHIGHEYTCLGNEENVCLVAEQSVQRAMMTDNAEEL